MVGGHTGLRSCFFEEQEDRAKNCSQNTSTDQCIGVLCQSHFITLFNAHHFELCSSNTCTPYTTNLMQMMVKVCQRK